MLYDYSKWYDEGKEGKSYPEIYSEIVEDMRRRSKNFKEIEGLFYVRCIDDDNSCIDHVVKGLDKAKEVYDYLLAHHPYAYNLSISPAAYDEDDIIVSLGEFDKSKMIVNKYLEEEEEEEMQDNANYWNSCHAIGDYDENEIITIKYSEL